jgi:CheY-like chemotaxis protein
VDAAGIIVAINQVAQLTLDARPELVGEPISSILVASKNDSVSRPGMHTCTLLSRPIVCFTKTVGELSCLNLMPGVPPDEEFSLALTARTDEDALHSDDTMPSPLPALARDVGLKVLLVEDDEFQAYMMRDMCEHNGFQIDVCANGHDALQKIFDPASTFNLVLLDLVMAPMHGLDILKAIRTRDERITVVIISNSDEKHVVKVRRAVALEAGWRVQVGMEAVLEA